MARKVEMVKIADEGRDRGKIFVVTEMPASKGEKWANKVLIAVAKSGVMLTERHLGAGWAGLAVLGFQALKGVEWEQAEPLLDEMMQCVTIEPDPRGHPGFYRELVEEDIEEIMTRFRLRMAIFDLHLGFLKAVAPLKNTGEAPVRN